MFPYFVAVAVAATTPAANENVVKFRTLTAVCDDYAKALAEALGNESLAVGRVTVPFGLATGMGVEAELTAARECHSRHGNRKRGAIHQRDDDVSVARADGRRRELD